MYNEEIADDETLLDNLNLSNGAFIWFVKSYSLVNLNQLSRYL